MNTSNTLKVISDHIGLSDRALTLWVGCLLAASLSFATVDLSAAQDARGVTVRISTGPDSTADIPTMAVRRRIQTLRGGGARVIYPIIVVMDGDSLGNWNSTSLADQRRTSDLSRVAGYGVDPVTGRPLGGVVAGPDSINFAADGVDGATDFPVDLSVDRAANQAANESANSGASPAVKGVGSGVSQGQPAGPDPRATRELNVALSNELALLRARFSQLSTESVQSQQNQNATILALSDRIAELERDMNLLRASWPSANNNQPDTIFVSRTDTLKVQTVVQQSRVDTVIVVKEPSPPSAVEIEKALLDEGIFETVEVLFDLNKSTVQPASRNVLELVAQVLRANPEIRIQIGGHTDSSGPDAYNMTLSEKRAEAVRNYLISDGQIAADRLTSTGFGESDPAVGNDTVEGRALNRRVEFRVVGDQ